MALRLPQRRYLQGAQSVQTPQSRFGVVQWILSRALYRFQVFDLAQVPVKSRTQALQLELAQWTPFANSAYFIGWHQQQALVWAWDAAKVNATLSAQGLKPQRLTIIPESALHEPIPDGLALTRCIDGYEGQLWREGQLSHSRWWAQPPTQDEWLMLQRDAGLPPAQQQQSPPAARAQALQKTSWVTEANLSGDSAQQQERLLLAAAVLMLWLPTCWVAMNWYQTRQAILAQQTRRAQLQQQVEPLVQARNQALDDLTRSQALLALDPYPGQLTLMAKVAEVLPDDRSYLKEWDFQQGHLKVTLLANSDISTTQLVTALQKAGVFGDVKALPGREPQSVELQMEVLKVNG